MLNLFNYRDKESLILNLNNTILQQKIQAEVALNELKKEIEANSNKLYDEMKDHVTVELIAIFEVKNDLKNRISYLDA